MPYDLFFRGIKIGSITDIAEEFLSLSGTIAYDESLNHATSEAAQRLSKFIQLNGESARLMDIEDEGEQDVSADLKRIDEQLASFKDYEDTDDWVIVSDTGEVRPILCPIFHQDSAIVWRWNFFLN